MKKITILAGLVVLLGGINVASAHVIVEPSQVGIGAYQTFEMGVPVEKNIPTVGLKLIIPSGVSSVSPNVKLGWHINVLKSGSTDTATTTAIEWYGGSIPVGERDGFYFSAKVSSTPTTLIWKAYQTYSDGTVVSWDMDPSATSTDFSTTGPYSQTMVINDLSASTSTSSSDSSAGSWALTISLIALVIAAFSLSRTTGVKNHPNS